MKIGIVTIVSDNYGNRLQNYALQKYMQGLNSEIETYTFHRNYARNVFLAKIKHFVLGLVHPASDYDLELRRRFEEFNRNYIDFAPETIYKSKSNLLIGEKYDYFIAGSDQVWNPGYNTTSDADFCAFADPEKRLSYAASIGMETIPEKCVADYTRRLKNMKAVSIREEDGANLVKKICGVNAENHIDPTLLLSKADWAAFERQPKWYQGEKFILSYFLGESEGKKALLDQLSKEKKAQIVNVLDKSAELKFVHDPCEFVWLIHHAECVVTDSFHCVVFSIIFSKEFIITRRLGKENNTGVRLDSLLRKFCMQRSELEYSRFSNYDTSVIESVLDQEKEKSREYFRTVLGV